MRSRPFVPALASFVLAACAAAPAPTFHTLLAPPAGPDRAPAAYAIELVPVGIPPQVDQPQLMVRGADGALQPLYGERWAAPLDEEIRTALAALLSHRLGAPDVSGIGAGGMPVWRVQLDVQRFEIAAAGPAALHVTWRVRPLRGGAALLCSSQLREEAPAAGAAGAVQAQRVALARLADVIADAVERQGAAPTGALAQATQTRCTRVPADGRDAGRRGLEAAAKD